jgi:hypothetical protein
MMKHAPKSEPGKWRRPNDEEFENAFQRAAGSGGTDGWTGEEVAMMPKGAIRWFRHMTGRWEEAGEVPIVMTESWLVNLEKPGKAINGF